MNIQKVDYGDVIYIRTKDVVLPVKNRNYLTDRMRRTIESVNIVKNNQLDIRKAIKKFKVARKTILKYMRDESKFSKLVQRFEGVKTSLDGEIKNKPDFAVYRTYDRYLKDATRRRVVERKKVLTVSGAEGFSGIEKKVYREELNHTGRTSVLCDEGEAELLKVIVDNLQNHTPLNTMQIRIAAKDIALRLNDVSLGYASFVNELPSRNWFCEFKSKYRPIFFGNYITIQIEYIDDSKPEPTYDDFNISNLIEYAQPKQEIVHNQRIPHEPPPKVIINLCRFCMSTLKKNQSLEIPEFFYEKFKEFSQGQGLETSEEFPKKICISCYDQFFGIQTFIDTILSTQKEIKKLINGNNMILKVENIRNKNPSLKLFQEVEIGGSKNSFEEVSIKVEPMDYYENDYTYEEYLDEAVKPQNECFNEFIADLELPKPTIDCMLTNPEPVNVLNDIFTEMLASRLTCDFCGYSARTKFTMIGHMKCSHLPKIIKKPQIFTCKICIANFPSMTRLRTHVSKIHESGEYKCNECEAVYNTKERLRYHKDMHHGEKIMCPQCAQFVAPKYMKKHIRSLHTPSNCKYCSKSFHGKGQLRNHEKHVHEIEEKICEICSATFKNQNRLHHHMQRQHTNEKLSCPAYGCNYMSCRKQYIKLHLFNHRDIDEDEKQRLWKEILKIKGFWF